MTYTTEELIQILDEELKANWQGKRILASASNRINNPVLEKFLNLDKISKVFAYEDFRARIHEYQQEYQVSAIICRQCSFNDKTLRFPEICHQLIAIEGDKQILLAAKQAIIDYWWDVTKEMKFWLAGFPHQPISNNSLQQLILETQWAEIDTGSTEVYLGLCWGDLQKYRYQWAKPDSGCYRIIGSFTEPSTVNIY